MNMVYDCGTEVAAWYIDFVKNQGSEPNVYDVIEAGWSVYICDVQSSFTYVRSIAERLFGPTGYMFSNDYPKRLWFESDTDLLMFTLALVK